MTSKKIATIGVLTAMAIILSYFERMLPSFGPGIKLGLANIVVVICLYYVDTKSAFTISLVRVFVVGFLFGGLSSMLYALSGALLSFFGMVIIKKMKIFSIISTSVVGSVLHIVGQIFVAILVVDNIMLITYLPVLMMLSIISGVAIGYISYYTLYNMKFAGKTSTL
ncbi:MAG: Gx transporter family protein [Lachnospirales bacterium]